MNNIENRKWLHQRLQKEGYDIGDYDSFEQSLQDKENVDWYYDKSKKLGLDVGDRNEFDNLFVEQKSVEPYTHVYNNQGKLVGGTAYEGEPVAAPYSAERASLNEQVADNNRKFPKMEDLPWTKPQGGVNGHLSTNDLANRLSQTYNEGGMEPFLHSNEDKKVNAQYTPKKEEKAEDVWTNAANKFLLTERGSQLQGELAQIQDEITNKYLTEFKNSDEYKAYAGQKYTSQAELDEANKVINNLFITKYGEAINNDLQPYQQAYNNEMLARYGVEVESGLNKIAKNEAAVNLGKLSTSVNSELESIEKKIQDRTKAVRNENWKPGMPSSRDDQELARLRGERTYLDGAQELIEDSEHILQAAKDEKDGTFVGGVLRGASDKLFDVDTWTMGVSDLVGNLRMKNVLEKADKGEKLTKAEEALLDAAVNNMAINAYYRSDLGRGYKAGEVTGESLPFMLEFIINPISSSGNAIAQSLLSYGLKRFGIKTIGKNATKATARFIGDMAAASGMVATTGMPGVLGETVDRMNRDYKYGVDEEGNLNIIKEGDTSFGEALGKSATTRFLENQSEMIFYAFKGASKMMKGVDEVHPGGINGFMDALKNSKVGQLYLKYKNNPRLKEFRDAAKVGGIGEEYLEEVYNNFANVALGEMSYEDAVSLDKNIDTFLGLAPTQVLFSAWGLGSMAYERHKNRKDMERAFGLMSEEQKRKLEELQKMGKLSYNKDIAFFIRETIADQSLTPEQRRAEIEYAYDLAKQNAINDIAEAEVEDNVATENAIIDSVTDPSTGKYAEVDRWIVDEEGERVAQHGYIVGWIGESPIFLPEGMENIEENRVALKPAEWNPESLEEMDNERVKAINEEMIRTEAAEQAEMESKYAPEVLNAQMQQGVPFNTPTSQIVPVSPMPEGNGWIVEEHPIDTNNKVAKQPIVRELTNDEYRDMLQAQLESQEAAQAQIAAENASNVDKSEPGSEGIVEEISTQNEGETMPGTEEVRPDVEGITNQPTEEVATGNNLSPVEEVAQPQAEVQPQAPVIPTKKDGSIDFVTYGKDNSFKELGNLYGEKMPHKVEVTAKALAEDVIKAQQAVEKAQLALDNAPIGRDTKQKQVLEKAQNELAEVQKEANFWNEMDADIKKAQAERESMLNPQAEVNMSEEPMDASEFVAQQLANGNVVLTSESFKKETGYGETERKKFMRIIRKAENGGMTVEQAAEKLVSLDNEGNGNFFGNDTQAARDAIIDMLSSAQTWGDISNYIKNNREAQAAKESEGLREELEEMVVQNYHTTLEDYVLQNEAAEVDNPFDGFDIATKDAIFAEAEEEYQRYLKEQENGQTEGNIAEGSGSVLSEEQADNSGRIKERQEQGDGISQRPIQESEGSHDSQQEVTAEEKRRIPLRERANEWAKALGVQPIFIESIEEAPTASIRAEIEDAHKNGQVATGFVSNGKAYFFMPDLTDLSEVDKTFIHEVVAHKGLKEMLGEERFNKLCDKVWDMMSEKDKAFYENYPIVRDMKDATERHRAAADEYIAALSESVELTPEQKSVWDYIVQFVRDALDKALNGIIGKSQITNDDIAKLIKMSYANLKSGVEGGSANAETNRMRAVERLEENVGEVDAEKGDVRFAVRDVLKGEERAQAIKDLMAVTGRSKRTVEKWLKAEESLASVILNEDNVGILDMEADESVPSIWKNSDYPQGTVEFSNICKKRLPFTTIYQRLQKEFPDTLFDAQTLNTIRNTMKEMGEDVACALCFVEDRRQLLGEIGQGFIDAVKGMDVELNDNQKVALDKLRESGDKYVPNLFDIITLDGMKELRKKHPAVAQAFIEYNNARGMQSGRLFQAYSAYNREILKYNKKKVESINNNGGLRIFSFSDFEAHHLIDLVQVLTDCAAKGIKVQGYTKVPEFAKAVKDTNAKINRSLIPKGVGYVDADYIPKEGEAVSPNVINGKRLLFDTIEGIDVNNPNFFDSTNSKSVGNILVAINDEHARLAMADPFVDYIIGFHTGQSKAILKGKGIDTWVNYKNEQLDKEIVTDENGNHKMKNAPHHGLNIYTDVLNVAEAEGNPIKTAKQFTERFIDECNKRGWIPRFHRFLNRAKDGRFIYTPGYHKFLIDFKLFDKNGKILPQEAVVPVFDNEFNKQILDEYVKGVKEEMPNDAVYEAVKNAVGLGEGTHFRVTPEHKQHQMNIINETNPASDDVHTWIRSVEDIKSFEESLDDSDYADYKGNDFDPSYTWNMVEDALKTGKVTVYSSYPIKNGVFVTPSYMEAQSYGGTTPYMAKVNLEDVAWIDPTQGQLATDNKVSSRKAPSGIRFRFIGERGARNLDKAEEATTRLDNLAVAREMEAANKDAKTIKMATGWERGADGLWRYEVADNLNFDYYANVDYKKRHPELARFDDLRNKLNSSLLMGTEALTEEEQKEYDALEKEFGGYKEYHRSRKLKDYLDAPELFDAYPELRNVELLFMEMERGTLGKYLPGEKTIVLNSNMKLSGRGFIEQVLVHEIQHAIQHIEGFEQGANKNMQDPNKVAQKAHNREFMQSQLDKHIAERDELLKQKDALNDKMSAWYDSHEEDAEFDDKMNEYNRQYDEIESQLEIADRKVAWDEKWLDATKKAKTELGEEGYAKVAGEVEARNVTSRMKMSDFYRRNTLASETEDVAREDQIFLKEAMGVSEMGSHVDKQGKSRFRVVYHGSGAEFDKFNHEKMGSGAGSQVFGWGTYVTESTDIAKDYAKMHPNATGLAKSGLESERSHLLQAISFRRGEALEEAKRRLAEVEEELANLPEKSRILYEVEIPDEKRGNYIVWGNNVTDAAAKKVFDGIYDRLAATEEYDTPTAQKELKKELDRLKDAYGQGKSGIWKDLYGDVSSYLGSDKDASLFLRSLGYVGIKYPAGTIYKGNYGGAHNYVIFDENDLKIVQHTRFRLSPKGKQIQEEVDKFTSKYASKPVELIDPEMTDKEIEDAIEWQQTAKDLKAYIKESKSMGGYVGELDKILIFVENMKVERMEEAMFHENLHPFVDNGEYDHLLNKLYENGKDDEALARARRFSDREPEAKRPIEFFNYAVSYGQANGNLEDVLKYFDKEEQAELLNLLKTNGYDYEVEQGGRRNEVLGGLSRGEKDSERILQHQEGGQESDGRVSSESGKEELSPRERAERLKGLFDKVADMGLEGVLGNGHYNKAMMDIYRELPEEARKIVADDALSSKGIDFIKAMDRFLNKKAEPSIWEKVTSVIREWLRKAGFNLELTPNEVKYIWWRSKKPLDRNNVIEVAEDTYKKYQLKVGEFEDSPNPDGDGGGTRFRVVDESPLMRELESAYKAYDKKKIQTAVNNIQEAILDGEPISTGDIDWESVEDYNGESPKLLAAQYIVRAQHNIYLEKDTEQEYIRTGIKSSEYKKQTEKVDEPKVYTTLYKEKQQEYAKQFKDKVLESQKRHRKGMWLWNGLMSEDEIKQKYQSLKSEYERLIKAKDYENAADILGNLRAFKYGFRKYIKDADIEMPTSFDLKEGTRFRVENKLQVRDEYEATIKKGGYQAREAVQDAMLSLRKFQELIEKASGKKIRDFENAWMHENRLSSVVQAEIHDMERKFYKPMMDAVKKLMSAANLEQEQVADYLMLKHGVERNREMAVRKALTDDKGKIDRTRLEQWYQDKRNVRNRAATPHLDTWRKQQEELDNIALLYGADMSRDYSGLTSMFGTDDVAVALDNAYNEVEKVETTYQKEAESLGSAIKAYTQSTLDKSFSSGLMNREVYNELSKDMYDYYIPLRGFEETTSEEVYAYLDNERNAFNAPLKRAKGRSSKADNPFAYMKSIAESGIMQGNRNMMKQTFLNMVTNHPSDLVSVRNGVWAVMNPATGEWEAVAPPQIPNDATPADVENIMEAWEAQMEQRANVDPNVKKIYESDDVPYRVIGNRMNQHQVIVKRLGKSYTLTINGNPRLAMALNGMTNPNNRANDGKVAAFVSGKIDALNRELSAWYTTRNPDFVASNFMRDTFYTNTIVRAKEGNKYANNFHKHYGKLLMPGKMIGLFKKYENGTLDLTKAIERDFYEFMMNGGETGYSNLKDLEDIKKQISKELKGSRWEDVKKIAEKLDVLNRAVENTARFAAYRTSRQSGRSISRSVFDAKEISVNFNKKGAGGTFFGMTGQTKLGNMAAMVGAGGRAMYVFFNAAIQGTTNLMHVARVNPKGTSAGIAAMFLMGAVVPFLFAGDDDDEKNYYDIPEHVRRNHLIVPGACDAWISIPLPIEYRIMYGMGELLTSWRTGHERGEDIARKMLNLTGQALPLNFIEEGLDAFMPSALSPVWQVYNNESWTGLPIYKDNEFNKDDPEYTKAYKNVDRTLYNISKSLYEWTFDEENQEAGININPAVVETLARGYFGGLATQLTNVAKTAEMIAGEREFDWRSIPVANRLFKSGDERTKEKRITNEYFKNVDKLEFLQSRGRFLNKTKDGSAVPQEDKDRAADDLQVMKDSEVYKKYMEFKKAKKAVDKIYKKRKEKDSPELEKDYYEALDKANKALD